jgi:hypothetical protein
MQVDQLDLVYRHTEIQLTSPAIPKLYIRQDEVLRRSQRSKETLSLSSINFFENTQCSRPDSGRKRDFPLSMPSIYSTSVRINLADRGNVSSLDTVRLRHYLVKPSVILWTSRSLSAGILNPGLRRRQGCDNSRMLIFQILK